MTWQIVDRYLRRLERVSDARLDAVGGPPVVGPLFRALNDAHDAMEDTPEDARLIDAGVQAGRKLLNLLDEW